MNLMYYILMGVIVLVVAIDLYIKKKQQKSDSKDVEKFSDNVFSKESRKFNPLLLIGVGLIVFTIAFFLTDKYVYDGRLSDNSDGISLIQNLTFDKLYFSDLVQEYDKHDDSYYHTTYTLKNEYVTGILVDEFGNYEGVVINGFPEGKHISFYENGQKKSEGNKINGMNDGHLKTWYENGQIKYELIMKNGLRHGPCKEWYENGQIKTDYTSEIIDGFIAMNTVGYIKEWYENGQLKLEGFKRKTKNGGFLWDNNSDWHGSYKTFYDNGNPEVDQYYKDGEFNGLQNSYYTSGNIEIKSNYINGIPTGDKQWFSQDGVKYQEVRYNNGIGYVIVQYNRDNGKLSQMTYFMNGENWLNDEGEENEIKYDYIIWYKNGERIQKQNFRNGKEYGKRIFY